MEAPADIDQFRPPDILQRVRKGSARGLVFLAHDPPLLAATLTFALLVFLAVFGR